MHFFRRTMYSMILLNVTVAMKLVLSTWTLMSNYTTPTDYEQTLDTIVGPKTTTVHGADTEGRLVFIEESVSQEMGSVSWDVPWPNDLKVLYDDFYSQPFYCGEFIKGEAWTLAVPGGESWQVVALMRARRHNQRWESGSWVALRNGVWDSQIGFRFNKS